MSLVELQAVEGKKAILNKNVCIGHEDRVWSVAWSPKGDYLASSSSDKKIIIWAYDMATGTLQ